MTIVRVNAVDACTLEIVTVNVPAVAALTEISGVPVPTYVPIETETTDVVFTDVLVTTNTCSAPAAAVRVAVVI